MSGLQRKSLRTPDESEAFPSGVSHEVHLGGALDGAERAVLGAVAMTRTVESTDLKIRAGVHTGEVELVPGNVRGVAVHVTARIMALAGPGEVLVSDTTRGLVDGRELEFVDRGTHALKGVTGRKAIFAVE